MRRLHLVVVLVLFLQSCSAADLLPATSMPGTESPTRTSTPARTATITTTPTITLTPRNTPTDLFNTLSQTPAGPLRIPGKKISTITFTPTSTPSSPGGGFDSVTVTEKKIYWGLCTKKPHDVTMAVKVDNPEKVSIVYLFFRLESSKKSYDMTEWSGTVMDKKPNGRYTYTLKANFIPGRKNYAKAWIHYQFVAADEKDKVIGRTYIYDRTLNLLPCP